MRSRIPLAGATTFRVLRIEAEPPPHLADGSQIRELHVAPPVAVEVRLRRRDERPSDQEVDEVRAWLRRHREAARRPGPPPAVATPPPVVAAPVLALQVAPAARPAGARARLWPLLAVAIGLGTAIAAAVTL